MFKRVERKRKRKEEEEALGLDEETKEVLGLNDTDSDESASSGDDSSDNEDAEGADVGAEEEEGVSEEDDSEDEDEEATIPIRTALTNPIYVVAIEPTTTHSCAVCPGRILKGSQMLEVHNTSKAHHRRLKQFKAKASHHENLDDDSRVIIALLQDAKSNPNPRIASEAAEDASLTSKRALKSKSFFKARREKRKEKTVAQAKAKAAGNPDSAPPPKKKKKKTRKQVVEPVAASED